jgi:hypothetical protein
MLRLLVWWIVDGFNNTILVHQQGAFSRGGYSIRTIFHPASTCHFILTAVDPICYARTSNTRANQLFKLGSAFHRSTGILPVFSGHGQDARATKTGKLIGPASNTVTGQDRIRPTASGRSPAINCP